MLDLFWNGPIFRLTRVKWKRLRRQRTHPRPAVPVDKSESVRRYGHPFVTKGPGR